jgi:glyoxylase-like metal-dependent hydrolase (beta-lactamase superfamily II)
MEQSKKETTMRMSRRQSLATMAGSAGLLVSSPHLLARAALAQSAPSVSPSLVLASDLDLRSPATLAFLREMGVNTTHISAGGAPSSGGIAIEPTFAPVPSIAHGPAIPAAGYLVGEIRGGLYWVTDGIYQCMFLVTGQGVIVADAPPSIGPNILKAIASVTSEPVTHVVYSHFHADHIGAAGLFPGTATVIAHAATAAYLRRDKDPNRPVPTVTFTDSYTLRVGDQILQLSYKGENETQGNIFIYAPRQKVLMLVDVIFPGWVPFDYLAVSVDVPGTIAAYDQTLAYPFDTFVGGHLTRLGTRQDVLMGREYMQDLKANTAAALQAVPFTAVAAKVGYGNIYALAKTYYDSVVDMAATAMLAKWQGRLGGADVFTRDNCYAMQTSLRGD